MLFSIAWKNLWRNKLRSLIVIIAMTLGLIGGILSAGIMGGASDQSLKDALNDYVSEIQIHHKDYSENNELKFYIDNSEELNTYIKNIKGVKSVSSRVKILGMANSPVNAVGTFVNAIDPETEKTVTNIYKRIADTSGTYFESDRRNPIVISKRMAEKLQLKLNSKLVITFSENDSTYSGGAFRVCGIYKTYNSGYDGMNVFIRQSDLTKISSLPQNISHETAIRVPLDEDLEAVKTEILEKYPELSVLTWKESQGYLAMVSEMMDKMIYVFLIIILLALGFGIVNTMLMVVLERIKEVGMLMAIGMSKRRVFKMIMYETIFLSAVGGVVGMLISAGLLKSWGKNGINFAGMEEGFEQFGFATQIYPALDPEFYFTLSFLIILTGILASVYPAKKATKLNPVEALKTD